MKIPNLALMYADSKLPITSVKLYKRAFSMGQTLSAANLGFMYLDCGMADEAKETVEQAIRVENHERRVEKCLAEIVRRTEQEEEKESDLLNTASATRDVLVRIGQALSQPLPAINGRWIFPFGEIDLAVASGRLSGTAEIKVESPAYQNALFGTSVESRLRTDRYTLDGTSRGAVCEFNLAVENVSDSLALTSLSSMIGGPVGKSGFIVFDSDGASATYLETSDGKLSKPEALSKAH